MNIIEINQLTKTYGKARGIMDVSFQVQEGEIFDLLDQMEPANRRQFVLYWH